MPKHVTVHRIGVVYTKKGPVAKGGTESQRKELQEKLDRERGKYPDKYAALRKS